MADIEDNDEDLFADLYAADDVPAPAPAAQPAAAVKPEPALEPPHPAAAEQPALAPADNGAHAPDGGDYGKQDGGGVWDADTASSGWNANGNAHGNISGGGSNNQPYDSIEHDDNYGPINVKEDGKMFIGGLNWETTEQSLKDYFSQFGEVSECTVMRDSATGRSRGFGFLTFKEPKCVNSVMVKEHYLDGKIIDPKRAIPREEQERTSKIFVGGVSQEATEEDFKNFFKQFGRVVDATLMMDKDTGRPRGFGFVTFDGDAAVDATLQGPLQILGKPIEVKRAQPRGNMRDGEDDKKFGGGRGGKYGGRNEGNAGYDNQQHQNQQGAGGNNQGMSPAMMAQYWQRMQQYFQQMQQQLAAAQGGMPNPMAMGGMGGMGAMNPAMMQQMQSMMGGGMNPQTGSPMPQGSAQMNPAMMQQMQQMQQMQMQQQQAAAAAGGYGSPGPMSAGAGAGPAAAAGAPRPAYNAQEQLIFEQQKYEQQQARRMQQQAGYTGQGGPTSWEGMYDDIPQPSIPAGPSGRNMSQGPGRASRGRQSSSQPPNQPSNAPANAPTGPKNAGKPGANYRGGGRNTNNFRHNPYGHAGRG